MADEPLLTEDDETLEEAPRDAVEVMQARIDASGADVVWVGLGTPKQDFWMGDMRPLLKAPVLVAVGAAFASTVPAISIVRAWMRTRPPPPVT